MNFLPTRRRRLPLHLVVATAVALLIAPASPASGANAAAVVYGVQGWSVTASGQMVTATSTIASSATVTATLMGICARSSQNWEMDFPFQTNVALTSAGTTFSTSQVLKPGTYSMWPCVKVAGRWNDIGVRETVVVGTDPLPPAPGSSLSWSARLWNMSSNGQILTGSETISSSKTVIASYVGVCARNSGNGLVDFPFSTNVTLTPAGTSVSVTRVLLPGKYTVWACLKIGPYWHNVGPIYPLVVANPLVTPPPPPVPVPDPGPTYPSGEPMPTGNLPGWNQVFTDDFTKDVAMGGFPGPYAAKWMSYNGFPDQSGRGMYNQKIISAHDGELDMYLHSENGVPQGAGPVPLVNGAWGGQVYGRYTIRYRSDWLPGYGAGWLLWNDSGNWDDGEIDFPEGALYSTIGAYNHCVGYAAVNCLAVNTGVTFVNWHTSTIEWSPAGVLFFLDGDLVGSDTDSIPSKSLHWVLQTGTNGSLPNPTTSGHVLIDWIAAYTYAPYG